MNFDLVNEILNDYIIHEKQRTIKTKSKMKHTIAVLAVSAFTASAAVDRYSALEITLAVTVTVNNPNTTSNGAVTTYPKPNTSKMTTKTLMALIAADEHAEGHYSITTFPSGAKLIFMEDDTDFKRSYFMVTDSDGNELVDVSDLLTATTDKKDQVEQGQINDSNGLANGLTFTFAGEFNFDDTDAGGSTYFTLAGLETAVLTDNPSRSGLIYSESETDTIKAAAGMGEFKGNPAAFSGTVTASGKNNFPLSK